MLGWTGLLILVVAGLIGGFAIRRGFSGKQAFAAWAIWLAAPFVLLIGVFIAEIDPSWTERETKYNLAFGLVFYGLVIAVPWFAANLVAACLGRRESPVAKQTVNPAAVRAHSGKDLPDWSKPDNPRLNYQQLEESMRDIALRAGIDRAMLPLVSTPGGPDGDYIYLDKFDYIYIRMAGGKPESEHCSVIADELMYRVFVDCSAVLAAAAIDGHVRGSRPGEVSLSQEAVLARIDPRWAHQFALVSRGG